MAKIAEFNFAVQKYNKKRKKFEDVTQEELDKMLDGFIEVVEKLSLGMGGGGRLVDDDDYEEELTEEELKKVEEARKGKFISEKEFRKRHKDLSK